MKLTNAQLERVSALQRGFGCGSQTPAEIKPVEDRPGGGHTIAVELCGYVIYVNHMGLVVGRR